MADDDEFEYSDPPDERFTSGWESPEDAMKHIEFRFDRLESEIRELRQEHRQDARELRQLIFRGFLGGGVAVVAAVIGTGVLA